MYTNRIILCKQLFNSRLLLFFSKSLCANNTAMPMCVLQFICLNIIYKLPEECFDYITIITHNYAIFCFSIKTKNFITY